MSSGKERRLRPEDLADIDAMLRRLEGADETFSRQVYKRARESASSLGLTKERADDGALSLLLRASGLDEMERPGRRLAKAYGRLRAAFVAFGLVAGAVATTGVLVYDGTRPVNVLTFLALLLGVQLLLLLGLIVTLALGERLEIALPALGALRGRVSRMRARLALGVSGSSDGSPEDALAPAGEDSLYAGIDRWRSVALMQWLAVGFNVGIVAALIVRLAVTDVIFGWSTSFETVASIFPSLVEALSLPWAAWLPAAVPEPAIVEATRYVRVGPVDLVWAGEVLEPDVLLYSRWWAFLFAAVVSYGLLPRLVLLGVCAVMVRRRLRWALEQSRRLERLRRRIATPLVEVESEKATENGAEEQAGDEEEPAAEDARGPGSAELGPCALVLWGDIPDPREKLDEALGRVLGAKVQRRLPAGGLSFEVTTKTLESLAEGNLAGMPVVLLAEAYEAPAEELERFLVAVREGGRADRVVIVALVDVLEEDGWSAAREEDERMWRSSLRGVSGAGAHLLGPVVLPPAEVSK